MKIPNPPNMQRIDINFDNSIRVPNSYWNLESCIEKLNAQLEDGLFENRYFPKFLWFEQCFQGSRILNYGCGRREALALAMYFNSLKTVGIDNAKQKIDDAQRTINLIRAVTATHLPDLKACVTNIVENRLPQLLNEGIILRQRYEELLVELSQCLESISDLENSVNLLFEGVSFPEYYQCDLSEVNELGMNFDLIYGRCVLYLAERKGENITQAISSLAKLLAPESGCLVIVEPLSYEGQDFHYKQVIQELGLEIINETPENKLGGNEFVDHDPNSTTEIVGYIVKKKPQ